MARSRSDPSRAGRSRRECCRDCRASSRRARALRSDAQCGDESARDRGRVRAGRAWRGCRASSIATRWRPRAGPGRSSRRRLELRHRRRENDVVVRDRKQLGAVVGAEIGRVHPCHVLEKAAVQLEADRCAPAGTIASETSRINSAAADVPCGGVWRARHDRVVDDVGQPVEHAGRQQGQLPAVEVAGRPHDPVVVDAHVLDDEPLAVDDGAFEAAPGK